MKRFLRISALAMALLACAVAGYAERGGHGGEGGHYGGHDGGGHYGGYYGGRYGGHYWGHSGVDIWVDPGWGPGWWGPTYPYYPDVYYQDYMNHEAPPVVIQQQPEEYIQAPQQAEPSYWYYCQNPEGYYPYVKRCPKGWMRVIPTPPPGE